MQNEKDIYEASDDSQYGDKKAECEYGESREEDETTQYNNYTVEENSKKNMYGTEDNDQLTRLNIDCVEIEQCQVRPNCLRTLMMQVEDRTDTKRFDVIQQTTTNDGFEYFSTLFGDIQQAINYLRNYPNNDSAKMKRKNNELEYTNPDFSVHKSARTRKERCTSPLVRVKRGALLLTRTGHHYAKTHKHTVLHHHFQTKFALCTSLF